MSARLWISWTVATLLSSGAALLLNGCSVLLTTDDCTSSDDCPGMDDRCVAGACIPPLVADAGVVPDPNDAGFEADTGVPPDPCPPGGGTVTVSDSIRADTRWRSECVYVLTDFIFVEDAELEIEAGTVIRGQAQSALIVTTSGTIKARGRQDAPIVFTSSRPAGSRARGDWGGVALLGLAPINVVDKDSALEPKPQRMTERLEGIASDARSEYGGTDRNHSCGVLQYVRIEFAGFQDFLNNELNGLTVGGCGADTTLDFIQVHLGDDDGIEFFGGTAGLTHAVISRSDDDGLDWDEGWTGFGQFIIIQQDDEGDNAIEADGLEERNDGSPRSRPTLYNLTLIGSRTAAGGYGMVLREGTAGDIANVLVMGFRRGAIDIRDASTSSCARALAGTCQGGPLNVRGALLTQLGPDDVTYVESEATDDIDDAAEGNSDNGLNEEAWLRSSPNPGDPVRALFVQQDPVDNPSPLGLLDPYSLTNPRVEPLGNSPVLTATIAVDPPDLEQFDRNMFIGAVRTGEDWTQGWTSFPAN